jgi:hypothetical protein
MIFVLRVIFGGIAASSQGARALCRTNNLVLRNGTELIWPGRLLPAIFPDRLILLLFGLDQNEFVPPQKLSKLE